MIHAAALAPGYGGYEAEYLPVCSLVPLALRSAVDQAREARLEVDVWGHPPIPPRDQRTLAPRTGPLE